MSLTRNRMLCIQCQKLYNTCKKKIFKQDRLNKVSGTLTRVRKKLTIKKLNL